MKSDWYAPLRGAMSLGMLTADPGSLAGLHEARRQHQGQFFTPDAVAAFMWNLVKQEIDEIFNKDEGAKVGVFDNSVGSGRLLQFCDPSKHVVGGVDTDGDAIAAVQEVFEAAGFECHFQKAGMEAIRAKGWTVALINPPFSLRLDSVLMQSFSLNTHGKLGPGTSAQSDYYAIAQALSCAMAVVALVPRTVAVKVHENPGVVEDLATDDESRLLARLDLPSGSFEDEGAKVEVSVLVFGANQGLRKQILHQCIKDLSSLPRLSSLGLRVSRDRRLRVEGIDDSEPSITIAVTGDKLVKFGHDGRRITLKFSCGWTQARVLNAILGKRIVSTREHRLPDGYRYSGQGKLSIETHLLQQDPVASINRLIALIEAQDAQVEVMQGFWGYVNMRINRLKRATTPMAHTVWQKSAGQSTIKAVARKTVIVDKSSWTSPVIKAGTEVQFTRTDGDRFELDLGTSKYVVNFEELDSLFEAAPVEGDSGWVSLYPGKSATFVEQARGWEARLARMPELSFLSWGFQRRDLVELMICPRGAIVAWSMGTGKTRLAVSLILLSGVKHGLVTTEAYLVPEFVDQIERLGLDRKTWKVIKKPEDVKCLARINIISNQLLRTGIGQEVKDEDEVEEGKKASKGAVTYAHKLRRRIGLAVTDEGEYLSNPSSQRSRALWRVSAKRRYVLSGTPVPNTPRDMLPIMCYVGGDGIADQPWGYHGPYLEASHVNSVEFAHRGIEKFIEKYVELAWVTNEFAETLREGAKREIPSIKNVGEYRAMIAPYIKRRVVLEPDVQQHVQIPQAVEKITSLNWTADHLAHYVKVSDEFASWFQRQAVDKKSLMVVLMRFQAVLRALNVPQMAAKHVQDRFSGLTSKQQYLIDRAVQMTEQKRKTLMFVQSPDLAELLAQRVRAACGVKPLVLHGGMPIQARYELLKNRYRKGDQAVVMATFGVTQAGLNLPETENVILGARMFTAKAERQAIARALRPETAHRVEVEYVHINGSADEYLAQMVAFKGAALDEALDWASPKFDASEFVHMDTIIGRFIQDLAERKGLSMHDLRTQIKHAA